MPPNVSRLASFTAQRLRPTSYNSCYFSAIALGRGTSSADATPILNSAFRLKTTLSRPTRFTTGHPSLLALPHSRSLHSTRFLASESSRPPLTPQQSNSPTPHSKPSSSSPTPPPEDDNQNDEPERRNDSAAPQPLTPPAAQFGGATLLRFPAITSSPTFDAALTTAIGLAIVFASGIAYLDWYKWRVLEKIEKAFAAGYDPALELLDPSSYAQQGGPTYDEGQHIRRKEQDLVDDIIGGRKPRQYFLIMGPKGSGKGSMVLDAMHAVRADGVAFCEAHEDLEVFRLRLGRALNFEYMEDSQTGLFQRRDPREGGPALDIERALNKLEKVALRMREKRGGKPLVLCISNIHMFDDNEESQRLLLQFQQRAETWAASGILTLVFTTDDFWPYPILRKNANRMQILSVTDLSKDDTAKALNRVRKEPFQFLTSPRPPFDPESQDTTPGNTVLDRIYERTGGRLSLIGKIAHTAKNDDGIEEAMDELLRAEKAYLLSRIGLIPDLDDDVMDEQKWSSCSWLLLQEFVRLRTEDEKARVESLAKGETVGDLSLPSIPYWRCRQIMTRPDFLEGLDHDNIISIDVNLNVTLDSALMLAAAREVVEEEGFQEVLDNVRDRVDEIESLHRTSEVTYKDLKAGDSIRLAVDKRPRMV